jgi:hypothetical protein
MLIEKKRRLRAIALYIFPILLITVLLRSVHYFLLGVGIMNIIAGLSWLFPEFIGHKKGKYNNMILGFIATGILFLLVFWVYS